MTPSVSITKEVDAKCILITGGVGFLGSVCLEQLLRLTEVSAYTSCCTSKQRQCTKFENPTTSLRYSVPSAVSAAAAVLLLLGAKQVCNHVCNAVLPAGPQGVPAGAWQEAPDSP